MRTAETITGLAAFERRGGGSNSERLAALWLAEQLSDGGREVLIEPFWTRPNWALAHVWHLLLAIAGSLLSVHSPGLGGALILIALLSLIADALLGISPGRRLTPERASQNLVVAAQAHPDDQRPRLILTANYDAGRTGTAYRDRVRRTVRALGKLARGSAPGWLGWLVIALIWLGVTAILRLDGSHGTVIGAVQLVPTVGLVLALALLVEIASADFGPAAGDNGSGVAVAIGLARALEAAPPLHARIELVLQGAGDSTGIGLSQYLRARKRTLTPRNAIVVGIGPSASGAPRWWTSDGSLFPLRSNTQLRRLCSEVAGRDPGLNAAPNRGRGSSPALPARRRRIPAISIGCLDASGLAPRSHQNTDTAEAVEAEALDRAVEFGLLLVDAIDAHLGAQAPASRSRPDTDAGTNAKNTNATKDEDPKNDAGSRTATPA